MARVLVSVGEVSGDRLAAPLVSRLRACGHRVSGTAGPRCVAAGLRPIADFEGLAGHGISAAVRSLPAFAKALSRLRRAARGVDLTSHSDAVGAGRLRRQVGHIEWLGAPAAAVASSSSSSLQRLLVDGVVAPHVAAVA